MSSPLDKREPTPEEWAQYKTDLEQMARRDAARLLKDQLPQLAAESPIHYEELRNAVYAFEAEMLNEGKPEEADALGF